MTSATVVMSAAGAADELELENVLRLTCPALLRPDTATIYDLTLCRDRKCGSLPIAIRNLRGSNGGVAPSLLDQV